MLPQCSLPGVSCTAAGDIVALNLSGLNISTPLAAAAHHLVLLPSLRYLDLSLNHLTDTIPSSLFLSLRLRHLNLGQNFLNGPIPKEISFSVDLEYLSLHKNLLTGDIPLELTLLPNLRYLYLNENNLTGGLPNFPSHCSVSIISAGFCAACCFRLRYCFYMASNHHANFVEDLPEDLTYEDIMRATKGLSEKYVIGRGRYGTLYKIQIGMGNHCWVVKKVDLSEPSFSNEMKILNLVRHRNLVRMAGYCVRDGFGMIVYEYVLGGSLFDALHQKKKPQVPLDWEVRHRIALGIAQGLSYLHHDCVPQIIHRNLKSSNILLGSEMEPKFGDFGTSKLMDSISSSSDVSSTKSSIVGTLGYVAPSDWGFLVPTYYAL